MTLSISIDPDPRGSDHSFSDHEGSSGIHVPIHSDLEDHEDQDYDEWAHLPYPEELKPLGSASRPRTSRLDRPCNSSRSASGRRPTSQRMVSENQSALPRGQRQQSLDSSDSADSAYEYPTSFRREHRRGWQGSAPPAPGYAPGRSSIPSFTPYPPPPPIQRQIRERPRINTVSPDFILRSGDQAKDVTVHLDLDAAVDINPDLECLSRLNRLGYFKEASHFFEERLAIYVDFFPVVAEYADLLLEQGSFGHLHDFLSNRLKDPRVEYSDEEIQLVEACLRIIAYATAHSTFLQNETFRILLEWNPTPPVTSTLSGALHSRKLSRRHLKKPSSRSDDNLTFNAEISQDPVKNTPKRKYPRLGEWYRFLVREGFLWESHRILRAILPLLGDELCGQYTADGTLEDFADLDELSRAPDIFVGQEGISRNDEQLLFTELANASLFTAFFNLQTSPKFVLAIQRQFSKKAHCLATSILSTFPHLINTRPYLSWVLLEATRGLWMGIPFQPSVIQSRLAARVWSQDSAPRRQYLQPSDLETESDLSQPEQATIYSNWTIESRLKILSQSAKEIGDYHLQQSILQYLVQAPSSPQRRLTILQDLSQFCHKKMQDIAGYLQSLVDEYAPPYNHNFTDVSKKRLTLHRLSKFDNTFPSRFEYDSEARQSLNIVFFDLPSLAWLRLKVRYDLLKSLDRNIEADLSTVRLRHIEEHVPRHMLPDKGSTPSICVGCVDCGGSAKQPSPVEGINPTTSGASLATPSLGTSPYKVRRALAQERHESHLGKDDVVRNLEKIMKKD
ncbi:uncharacterized protein N7479_001364 [Penicillium vulpinum]|uniref:Uncharacterized protein n=1 Tax=Penicillium vulpinum TaxID=29845 RepID=A0A1V6RUP9_9EURO|nr:uncharacterized protein N7479_001364 [Penicillium vulpinum]KAJ5971446.1 hypothetical protein N7479_001364 [Penicillium vulpinum]OQE05209.1 hypothetical protein PENVUL_c026G06740 [Penicillium vulpinum]